MHRSDSDVFDVAYEPLNTGTSGTEDERAEEGRGWWKPAQNPFGAPIAQSGQTSGAASPTGSGQVGSRRNSPRSSKKAKAVGVPRESRARHDPQ